MVIPTCLLPTLKNPFLSSMSSYESSHPSNLINVLWMSDSIFQIKPEEYQFYSQRIQSGSYWTTINSKLTSLLGLSDDGNNNDMNDEQTPELPRATQLSRLL